MRNRAAWIITVVSILLSVLPGQAAEKPVAILHGRLINGLGDTPIENATVILRGRSIEYAGPASGASVPSDAQIIDATGKSVMPGLADMHVHLQNA